MTSTRTFRETKSTGLVFTGQFVAQACERQQFVLLVNLVCRNELQVFVRSLGFVLQSLIYNRPDCLLRHIVTEYKC